MTRRWLSALILAAALAPAARPADNPPGASYYPLKVGAQWSYAVTVNGKKAANEVRKVTRFEKVEGEACALVESSVGGKAVTTEHLSAGANGIYRHAFNGRKLAPVPLLFLKLP